MPILKSTCDLLIQNCSVLKEDYTMLENQSIAIQNGKIIALDDSSTLANRYAASSVRDGKHKLYMPGLIDAHMHTNQQLLRGRIMDELPMIWTRIMLPYESNLTPDTVELSAQLATLEMMKSGTTAFADAGGSFMDTAAKVYLQSGLRGVLTYSTIDKGNAPDTMKTSTQEAIQRTKALYDTLNRLAYLDLTFLVLIALCFLKQRKPSWLSTIIKVAHCPFSNCVKAIPPMPSLLEKGITVALGSDGTAHGGMSLWNEMKIFRSVMNVTHGIATSNPVIMPAKTLLHMATQGGASAIKQAHHIGQLTAGYTADLIGIHIDQPHLYPTHNLVNTLVESVNANNVVDMVVNGKFIIKDRQVLTLDEERILYDAKKYFSTLNS